MTPSVDYADPEPPPMPVIEAVAAPKAMGPVDTPWERLDAQRTEIETVKPPDELVRPAGPPGIICPACRTENEASRRFCQSCGTPLVDTAPIQPLTRQPMKRSYKWLLVLIPIVLIAGFIGFGGAALLKGGLPVASATVAPPSGGSLTPTAGASGPGGSVAVVPTASASSGLSVHGLALYQITSSSHRDQDHSSGKSIDYQRGATSTETEWQADASGGKDIWIEVQFKDGVSTPSAPGPVDLTSITIFPGDQSSEANFPKSARPHHIVFTADGGHPLKITLDDRFGSQDFAVDFHVKKNFRITIIDNYPGTSSQFSGISEIRFVGVNSP